MKNVPEVAPDPAPLHVILSDGTPGMIWPLLPEDREGLRVAYERLSDRSKYHRFLSDVDVLSEPLLRLLVDSVDGVEHVALLLVALPEDGPEETAGVGRILRHPDLPEAADVGVTVADAWQGRGVATALLAELMHRRPPGVRQIMTNVATDNRASIAMLARLGDLRTTGVGGGVYDVVVDLRTGDGRVPAPRERRRTGAGAR
jgi:RimJ/RimL family protein N-acetyltransferase